MMKLLTFTAFMAASLVSANESFENPNGGSGGQPRTPTPGSYGGQPQTNVACQVLALSNQYRQSNGRAPLIGDERLDGAAAVQCQEMIRAGRLAHTARAGSTPASRVEDQGYNYRGVAENIYVENGMGNANAGRAVDGWFESAGHRKNLLGDYISLGSAACTAPDGSIYWAQVFGKGDDNGVQNYDCGAGGQPSSGSPTAPPSGPSNPAPSPPSGTSANSPSGANSPPPSQRQTPITRYGPNGRPCKVTPKGARSLSKRAMKKSLAKRGVGQAYSQLASVL